MIINKFHVFKISSSGHHPRVVVRFSNINESLGTWKVSNLQNWSPFLLSRLGRLIYHNSQQSKIYYLFIENKWVEIFLEKVESIL